MSFRKGIASRNASIASGSGEKGGAKHNENIGPGRLSPEIEQDGDDDVANGETLTLSSMNQR